MASIFISSMAFLYIFTIKNSFVHHHYQFSRQQLHQATKYYYNISCVISLHLTLQLPDQICNSPYCQPYNFYNVSSENLVWDQLIIPKLIFVFILITYLVDTVLVAIPIIHLTHRSNLSFSLLSTLQFLQCQFREFSIGSTNYPQIDTVFVFNLITYLVDIVSIDIVGENSFLVTHGS